MQYCCDGLEPFRVRASVMPAEEQLAALRENRSHDSCRSAPVTPVGCRQG